MPSQPPKANRPHAIHRPSSTPDTSDFHSHQPRCASDEDDDDDGHGPRMINESPAINDAPSKLTPATQVPSTNERTNDQKARVTDDYSER